MAGTGDFVILPTGMGGDRASHIRVTRLRGGGTLIEFIGEAQNSEAVELGGTVADEDVLAWYRVEALRA